MTENNKTKDLTRAPWLEFFGGAKKGKMDPT